MAGYDAIIFDNDGVLVEPPAIETLVGATRSAFREVGVESPEQEHVEAMTLSVRMEELESVCETYELDTSEFWRARDTHASRAQQAEFRDGGRAKYDDVVVLGKLDHDLGIVSSNQHETIEFVLDHCEFTPLFDTYYGRELAVESIQRKKPEPYYIERAVADLDAESALYVGDSESDVVAATRAGLDSAFVRRPHRTGVELSTEPTYDVPDLHAVAERVTGP